MPRFSQLTRSNPRRSKVPEPLPADPLGQRLCTTFSYRWNSIVAPNPDAGEKPQWSTETRYPLRPRVLWTLWQDAAQLVGVRFGHTTKYGLFDIDIASQYLTPEWLAYLKAVLETIGICRVIIVRSSWSGGIHIYLPLPEAIPTWQLALALKQCLLAQDLTIAPGQLEVFPNCKAWGNNLRGEYTEYQAHRLPLQPSSGSVLLNDDLQPIAGGLAQFFEHWDQAAAAQDLATLKSACTTAKANHKGKYRVRKHDAVDSWRSDLETEIAEGWTAHGQTNHLLKTIACYGVVFERLSGDNLVEYVQRIATTRAGYKQWCRHQHEISLRCQVWARAAAGYYWALGSERTREGDASGANNIVPFNQSRSENAQSRIRSAVQAMEEQNTLPSGVTERAKAIAAQSHTSSRTLYKYPNLWHPQHLNSERCKTDAAATVVAPEPLTSQLEERSPEQRQDKEFYTKGENMKGEGSAAPEFCPSSAKADPEGGSGGFSTAFAARPSRSLRYPTSASPSIPDAPSNFEHLADLSDVTAEIRLQVKRLGLTRSQVDSLIAQHFAGRRWSQLSDDDEILLLYQLRDLKPPD